MPFFKQFPKKDIQLENIVTNPTTGNITRDIIQKKIVDIYRHVDVTKLDSSGYTSYQFYEIQDGERPDTVSFKLYKTPDLYWTFFIVNDFLQAGFNEWYKSDNDFDRGIQLEYGNYGAIVFTPDFNTTTRTSSNNYGGLDLEKDFVRLIAMNPRGGPIGSCKPVKYDAKRLTLIVDKSTFMPATGSNTLEGFFNATSYRLGIDVNGFTPGDTNNYKAGLQTLYNEQNPLNTTLEDPIEIVVRPLSSVLSTFAGHRLISQTNRPVDGVEPFSISPTKVFSQLETAPYSYKALLGLQREGNADAQRQSLIEQGDTIDAYQALVEGFGDINSAANYTTYLQDEQAENERKRKIVTIKPEFINDFVEEYKALIQS